MPRDTNKPSKKIASEKDSEPHAPEEEEESGKKKNAELDSDGDDDDDDDEELFNLAQKWADSQGTKGQKGGDETVGPTKSEKDKQQTAKKRRKSIEANVTGTTQECRNLSSESNDINDKPRNQCSLHITNLPYNATKEEIVQAFSNKGCRVISTRLVYNYHTSRRGYDKGKTKITNSNGFTGVAFVDLADGKSYKLGLEMDKMIWGSQSDVDENDQKFGRGWKRRRINVRPTKTKEELAQIVAQTKLKLAAQKQDRKEEINGGKQTLSVEKYTGHKQGRDSTSGKARRSPEKKRKLDKNHDPSSSKKKKKQKSEERKLTKKDRAKKAAILRSKKVTK